MLVPDAQFSRSDRGRADRAGFLYCELPAFAGGAIGAVVGAGAGDEESRVGLHVDRRAHLSVTDVVEMLRRFGGEGVDTLGCV